MPLIKTSGAASAKGFGEFSASSVSTAYAPAEKVIATIINGPVASKWVGQATLLDYSGSVIASTNIGTYSSYISNTICFGGFNKGYAEEYYSNKNYTLTSPGGVTVGSNGYTAYPALSSYGVLSTTLAIACYGQTLSYSTNSGASWATTGLGTATGYTVNGVLSMFCKGGTAYLVLHTGASSPYTLRVYKTTNGTSFTSVGTMGTTTQNGYSWNAFYNYTTGIFSTNHSYASGGTLFNLNVNTEAISTGTYGDYTNVSKIMYLNGTYYGIKSGSVYSSTDLSTWTLFWSPGTTLVTIFPLKDRIAAVIRGTTYYSIITYNVLTSATAYIYQRSGLDSSASASYYCFSNPVTSGDNYWQGG